MKTNEFDFLSPTRLTRDLIRTQFTPILVIFALSCLLNLTLEDLIAGMSGSQDNERWKYQLALGLWEMVEGVIIFLILSWGVPKIRALTEAHFERQPFQSSYLNSFLAEYLRMMAQTLMYALLLLLPGFFRYTQLIFVPYIALFIRPYREGQIDAVALSTALTRGRVLRYMLVILGVVVLSGLVDYTTQFLPTLHILPLRIFFHAISFYFSIWLYSYFYSQLEARAQEFKWT